MRPASVRAAERREAAEAGEEVRGFRCLARVGTRATLFLPLLFLPLLFHFLHHVQ